MTAPLQFNLTLHHLAADATKASYELPDVTLPEVTLEKLRLLLEALAKTAPTVVYPATPEIRIAAAEGQFLVQVKEGHVRFSSWSVRSGAADPSPAEILAAITGTEVAESTPGGTVDLTSALRRPRRGWMMAALAIGILGSNGITAWMLTRPPPDLLPAFRLLDPEAGKRLLTGAAGTYETGDAQGDRRLRIERDGRVAWEKFGDNRAIEDRTELTAQSAQSAGHPSLLTSARALIEIKDASTIVYFGDTYHRTRP